MKTVKFKEVRRGQKFSADGSKYCNPGEKFGIREFEKIGSRSARILSGEHEGRVLEDIDPNWEVQINDE